MTTITADLVTGYRVDITNERHRWTADEPAENGGDDAGPSPYEMLLGAAAACTAITLSMYAQRKGIDLDSVSVRYSFDRVHTDDCAGCLEGAEGWLHRIQSQVFVEGRFDEEQRRRLTEIATRCPVHKTLEQGVVFVDEVFVG
jgi:putative redox protein